MFFEKTFRGDFLVTLEFNYQNIYFGRPVEHKHFKDFLEKS